MGRKRILEVGQHHELGERVRTAMDNAGFGNLSYEKLGAKIGINASAYGKLVNGHNAGSYETLKNICLVTGVNFEWLTTGRGPMIYSLTNGIIDLNDLPSSKRESIKAIVEEIKKSLK